MRTNSPSKTQDDQKPPEFGALSAETIDQIASALGKRLNLNAESLVHSLSKEVSDRVFKLVRDEIVSSQWLGSDTAATANPESAQLVESALIDQLAGGRNPESKSSDATAETALSASAVEQPNQPVPANLTEAVSTLKSLIDGADRERKSLDDCLLKILQETESNAKSLQALREKQEELDTKLTELKSLSRQDVEEVLQANLKAELEPVCAQVAEIKQQAETTLGHLDEKLQGMSERSKNAEGEVRLALQGFTSSLTHFATAHASSLSDTYSKLKEDMQAIVVGQYESVIATDIQAFTKRSETLLDTLRTTLASGCQLLNDSRTVQADSNEILRQSQALKEELESREVAVREKEERLLDYQIEAERLEQVLAEQKSATDQLTQQHQSLVSAVEKLDALQKTLSKTERPAILLHPALSEEVLKLGNNSVQSLLLMGTLYQFQNSLVAVQRKPDDLELLSHLQEVLVQLGIGLMRHINQCPSIGLVGERWRRAIEESVQSWFRIHLPIVGQPFNLSLMDVSKPGTVRVVKSWTVLSNDPRLRSKLATVE